MTRPMQVSPPRVTDEVHEWLLAMSRTSGLTISAIVGAILERARAAGWVVEPLTVRDTHAKAASDG